EQALLGWFRGPTPASQVRQDCSNRFKARGAVAQVAPCDGGMNRVVATDGVAGNGHCVPALEAAEDRCPNAFMGVNTRDDNRGTVHRPELSIQSAILETTGGHTENDRFPGRGL